MIHILKLGELTFTEAKQFFKGCIARKFGTQSQTDQVLHLFLYAVVVV